MRVARQSARDRVTTIAASLAFHAFLALVPTVIAAVGLLGVVGLSSHSLHSLLHAVSVLLPTQMSRVVTAQLLRPPSVKTNLTEVGLGVLVATWSAVEAMAALQVALDVAYEVPNDRGPLGRRIAAVPLLAITLVLGGSASILLVLGGPIGTLVPAGFVPVLSVLRYAGSIVLVVLLLSAFYSFGPARPALEWEWVSPGGIAGAAGWILSSLAFSFYLDHLGHASRTDGALAGVAVSLLWFFLTSLVVLYGAELNRELERMTEAGART